MGLDRFRSRAEEAVSEIRGCGYRDVLLIHHDDADGLSSAAVMMHALQAEGFEVRLLCLEKVYPEVIRSVHDEWDGIIVYTDIGSAHGDMISNFNRGRNLTLILDHHDPRPPDDPRIYDLNLEYYGFRGEEEFSGATISYLFAKAMNEENVKLSYLALVGSQEIPGRLRGLNRHVLEEAVMEGVVMIERNRMKINRLGISVKSLFSKLQVLGPVGYYVGGPEAGVKLCLEGLTDKVEKITEDLEAKRKAVNRRLLAILYRKRLNETEHIQWFDAGNLYKGMGSKVIGQFCSLLSYHKRLIKPDKYIFGVMNMDNLIPGWGRLEGNLAKASIRTPRRLRSLIRDGKSLSAVDLLTKASEGFGFADGHEYAASVVVPAVEKRRLILQAENILQDFCKA
ncbi:TPA: DHH family phosphoesterase [Candidatus Bathyarchaeota archaeon]|nr:DHH family phosphoesterase [Candidatus Bathyarchaeota archaeon]